MLRQKKSIFLIQEKILSYGNGARNPVYEANPRDSDLLYPKQLCFCLHILDHHQRCHWIKSFVDKKEKRRRQQTASEGHWSNLFMTWTVYTFQFFISPVVHLNGTTWGGNTWQRLFMSSVNHGTIFSFKPLKKNMES